MHLAAQYLRVVLLFFSYSDKRFRASLCCSLQLDSRNLSLPVWHLPSLTFSLSQWHNGTVFFCRTLHLSSRRPSFSVRVYDFLKCYSESVGLAATFEHLPYRFNRKYDNKSINKAFTSKTKTSQCASYVRGTSSWGYGMVQLTVAKAGGGCHSCTAL